MPRQILRQLVIQTLVHRGHHAAHEQPRDQVLGANAQLFRQVLHAGAFANGDAPRDRHGFIGKSHAWWRSKALHWTFFRSMLISLSRTPRLRPRTSSRFGRHSRRRTTRSSAHSRTWRETRTAGTGWMWTTTIVHTWTIEWRTASRSPTTTRT